MSNNESSADSREVALGLAVEHHAAANRAVHAIPANPETVIATAAKFEGYVLTGTVPASRSKQGGR